MDGRRVGTTTEGRWTPGMRSASEGRDGTRTWDDTARAVSVGEMGERACVWMVTGVGDLERGTGEDGRAGSDGTDVMFAAVRGYVEPPCVCIAATCCASATHCCCNDAFSCRNSVISCDSASCCRCASLRVEASSDSSVDT